jgi:hypothetical protein
MTEEDNPGCGWGLGGGGGGWGAQGGWKTEAACDAEKNENAASRKEDKVG